MSDINKSDVRPDGESCGVALVTGSAKRVGLAIALALAKSGRDIFIHSRSGADDAEVAAEQVRALGRKAWIVTADLTNGDEVAAMFEEIKRTTSKLDILVNSAAVFATTPPDSLSEQDFDYFIDTNLKGPYLCCIQAKKLMPPGSNIISITDVAAERPFSNHVPYCVSKAGLVMLTRALAKAWAPDIRVNAIAPGTVLFREDEDEHLRKIVISRIPLKHIGTPNDVAEAVLFLIDHAAHTTGVVIPVDGGRNLD